MRVTTKGQVTIPQDIREKMEVAPSTEVNSIEKDGRVYLIKVKGEKVTTRKFSKLCGIAGVKMTTDEIMSLTREVK